MIKTEKKGKRMRMRVIEMRDAKWEKKRVIKTERKDEDENEHDKDT